MKRRIAELMVRLGRWLIEAAGYYNPDTGWWWGAWERPGADADVYDSRLLERAISVMGIPASLPTVDDMKEAKKWGGTISWRRYGPAGQSADWPGIVTKEEGGNETATTLDNVTE